MWLIGGDLAPSLGDGKSSQTKISEWGFLGTNFFSHCIFFIFFIYFFWFSVSLLCEMSYMTHSSPEKPLFQKIMSLWHLFLLCSHFGANPTTLLLKILGGGCMSRPPTSNFRGTVPPQSPLGLRPWYDSWNISVSYSVQQYEMRTYSKSECGKRWKFKCFPDLYT